MVMETVMEVETEAALETVMEVETGAVMVVVVNPVLNLRVVFNHTTLMIR